MSTKEESCEKTRKNYPGEERIPGSKDYSVILGNLIHYKHQLVLEKDPQKIGVLMNRIAVKLKELGFKDASQTVKTKLGRKKEGKYQEITLKKKEDTIEIALKFYEQAKERNEKAKEKIRPKRRKTNADEAQKLTNFKKKS